MAEWNVQNPQENPQHPYNFVTPLDTQQHAQRQQFPLPSQHTLEYLSPPMPPSPYTPQSLQSPTPPQMPREDSFASSYQSSQHSIYPQQFAYAPDHASAFPPPPPPVANQPRSRGRAVCIGINYFNQKGEMKGRTDEARNLSCYLQQVKNYTPESIILLTDDQNGPFGQPTKRNILSALHWLGEHAQQGERLVLYYSGHGRIPAVGKKNTRTKQGRQDEIETIYPVDFRSFKEGMIKPEELEELLEPVRRKGAKLTLILDTHAGVVGKKGESPNQ
ncbi:hypothetical protein DV736_g5558, partial [Chaetothyriales sp. CBS 134916]